MILYHGSNIEIDTIDFDKSKPGKDFGIGFYLSADEKQAQEMAAKKALLLGGTPVVTRFEFDKEGALIDSNLDYKQFEKYSIEWGEFIKSNRDNKTRTQIHNYDIVYGPIANDTVGFQLRRLNAKIIDIPQFVKEIQRMGGETYQFFFGTEKAIQYLKKL
ncbi:DUF3990 domain-containing protein [Prevotella sp. lc2012]|uniref:DUF3990 domain-containing protein n=1 Tax=Prevotella sp. lc2012 TaxID=1761886 RepID=UPI00089AB046|nr:DUF3990 domain-containing protein [Prevotella sp. lc2012]SEE05852.1 Protein of unknown function [Prevotella sp. lc2012]